MTNLRTVGKTQYETPPAVAEAMRETVEAMIRRGVIVFLAFAEICCEGEESRLGMPRQKTSAGSDKTEWVVATVPFSDSLVRGMADDLYDFVEGKRQRRFYEEVPQE